MNWESLGSCDKYIKGKALVKVCLPVKAPTCQYCNFLSCHSVYDRYYCKLTGEWLLDWKKERGSECPVVWEEE